MFSKLTQEKLEKIREKLFTYADTQKYIKEVEMFTSNQALRNYLEILGLRTISELPKEKGKPPREDPQIFLGALSLSTPVPIFLQQPPSIVPVSPIQGLRLSFLQYVDIKFDISFPHPYSSLLSVDLSSFIPSELLAYINQFPSHIFSPLLNCFDMINGINHPRFICISKHHYAINNPDSTHRWYVHVGQIMNYIAFD
jgi:hypothetical protein